MDNKLNKIDLCLLSGRFQLQTPQLPHTVLIKAMLLVACLLITCEFNHLKLPFHTLSRADVTALDRREGKGVSCKAKPNLTSAALLPFEIAVHDKNDE